MGNYFLWDPLLWTMKLEISIAKQTKFIRSGDYTHVLNMNKDYTTLNLMEHIIYISNKEIVVTILNWHWARIYESNTNASQSNAD